MALSFLLTRPFMTSVIIGATNMEQLKINIGSHALILSHEVKAAIHAVYRMYPLPI